MKLLPAIDLIGGRCVRLRQGRFDEETVYSDDPPAAARAFAEAGAEEVHVVDLDGAKAGEPKQHALFADIAAAAAVKLQVAGGFRSVDHVAAALDKGAHRVIVGSLALARPDVVEDLVEAFGEERIGVALDVTLKHGVATVATHGWTRNSDRTLIDAIRSLGSVRHILVTDIARDGMMQGPNIFLMEMLAREFQDLSFQASGGVASLTDLGALRRARAARAIVGKALWEGRFGLKDALRHAGG